MFMLLLFMQCTLVNMQWVDTLLPAPFRYPEYVADDDGYFVDTLLPLPAMQHGVKTSYRDSGTVYNQDDPNAQSGSRRKLILGKVLKIYKNFNHAKRDYVRLFF